MTQTRPEPAAEAGRHPRYPAGPGYDPTQGHAKGQTWPEHGWPIQPEPAYDSTAHQAAPLD